MSRPFLLHTQIAFVACFACTQVYRMFNSFCRYLCIAFRINSGTIHFVDIFLQHTCSPIYVNMDANDRRRNAKIKSNEYDSSSFQCTLIDCRCTSNTRYRYSQCSRSMLMDSSANRLAPEPNVSNFEFQKKIFDNFLTGNCRNWKKLND